MKFPPHSDLNFTIISNRLMYYCSGDWFSFSYTISDGHGGTATADVVVIVNLVITNHPPALSVATCVDGFCI